MNDGLYQEAFNLGPYVEGSQAAMYSLKRMAIWLLKNQPEITGKNVTLYTSSKPCLDALDKVVTTSKLEYKVFGLLNAAATKCDNLYVRWVKQANAHIASTITLAKEAITTNQPVPQDVPLPSKITVSRTLADGTDELWVKLFHLLQYPEECRQTKQWWPTVDKNRTKQLLKLNRLQWGKLVQFMTGHNYLQRHNNIVDPNDNPSCPLCDYGYPQDTAHIIGECPYPHLVKIRVTLFGERVLYPPYTNLPLHKVLTFLIQSGLPALDWVEQK